MTTHDLVIIGTVIMVDHGTVGGAERAAARAELDNAPPPDAVTEAEVYAMIDSLGDVASALTARHPDKLIDLYDNLRLDLVYDNEKRPSM